MIAVLTVVAVSPVTAWPPPEPEPKPDPGNNTNTNTNINDLSVNQTQDVYVNSGNSSAVGGDASATAEGGDAKSDSFSSSKATINNSSVTEIESRTPPPTIFPPYLPYWNHGGWGTIKAYFSNGPSADDAVYERTFDPDNPTDMRQLRGVLQSLPYDGPLEAVGGFLNTIGAALCGIDNYHHGRGFQIANSLVRERRENGKPLLVFIDTNVDTRLLRKAGYAYVGKVGIEGDIDRNWDQVYDAVVAEALPWDVDILLISGGMKGVTVGSNTAFPGGGGAYSRNNYAFSLVGSVSSGITEGKGKAMVSAEGYRFSPQSLNRRRIPDSFYERIRAEISVAPPATRRSMERAQTTTPRTTRTRRQQYSQVEMAPSAPISSSKRAIIRASASQKPPTPETKKNVAGVEVSRRLWEVADFDDDELVEYVIIR